MDREQAGVAQGKRWPGLRADPTLCDEAAKDGAPGDGAAMDGASGNTFIFISTDN